MLERKNRADDELRSLLIEAGVLDYPPGSARIRLGRTEVLVSAYIDDKVPQFLRGTGCGWITAEYIMLPFATPERQRIVRPFPDPRAVEIGRIIGRALRAGVDLCSLGEKTIVVDAAVVQADGGTRTAAISAGFVALYQALCFLQRRGELEKVPVKGFVAAVSVGVVEGRKVLDLDANEDQNADVDLNVAMLDTGEILDIQGTSERRPVSPQALFELLELAKKGMEKVVAEQRRALKACGLL